MPLVVSIEEHNELKQVVADLKREVDRLRVKVSEVLVEDKFIPLSEAKNYFAVGHEGLRNMISESVRTGDGVWVEKKHGKDGNFMYSGNKILVSSNFLKSQINISEPVMKVVRG